MPCGSLPVGIVMYCDSSKGSEAFIEVTSLVRVLETRKRSETGS